MSKTKPNAAKADAAAKASAAAATPVSTVTWGRTIRETVESIVIAFILAFLFRTFEAEAFVIPTGSMAPTLQGRHKDVVCPKCGYEFRAGASQEVDDAGRPNPNCFLAEATCPMCRYTVDVGPGTDHPSYSGDRIIVSKFAFDLSNPERWEVTVFKYPEDAKTNYIKRLVGLPNERLLIAFGDIYTAPLDSDDFNIERKGKRPEKLLTMLQPVYDNDFVATELLSSGFPSRWQPWSVAPSESAWKASEDGRSFSASVSRGDRQWLRYQHILPNGTVWDAIDNDRSPQVPAPSLIKDFYAYNDGEYRGCGNHPNKQNWVGDLALSFEAQVESDQGSMILELIKGGRQFRCTIDLATGEARLSIAGLDSFSPKANTKIRGPGAYHITFANVDEQLLLWIDDEVVEFDGPTTYASLGNYEPNTTPPVPGSETATDLSPVGIAVEGGADVTVSHLNLRRDIFYVSDSAPQSGMRNVGEPIDIEADQYFMLGDNSPQSKDSRYWRATQVVDRSLLIGKALFIYWPHSFDQIEIGDLSIPFPYWPNFRDMGFVR